MLGNDNRTTYFDNISVYAVEPTLGTPYTDQFTYLSENGKLLAVEVADGKPVDIHLDDTESNEVAPFISVPAIQADTMVANEYKGKNACTAWVNFDGTTTPPTIRDSYNVSSVVRRSTGYFFIYFENNLDNTDYTATVSVANDMYYGGNGGVLTNSGRTPMTNMVEIGTYANNNTEGNSAYTMVQIFGGKA
jgi:hypothetical protein